MSTATTRKSPPVIWIVLGVIVVLALVIAVLVSAGGDEGDDTAGLQQIRAVTVAGDALPEFTASAEDPAVGQVAPELRGASFDGSPVELTRDGRGKLVVFVAHWCPHCQVEVPEIVEHLRTVDLPEGVDLVAVSTAVSERQPNYPPSRWLERESWTAPVLVDDGDGAASRAYGLGGFPFFVGLDADGTVVGRVAGEFPMDVFDAMAEAVTP